MNRDEILSTLISAKTTFHIKYRVKKIGIFGSVARGTNRDDSDLDVYAEFEPDADILDYSGLIIELENMFHKSIDIATPRGIRDEMRTKINRDLILV